MTILFYLFKSIIPSGKIYFIVTGYDLYILFIIVNPQMFFIRNIYYQPILIYIIILTIRFICSQFFLFSQYHWLYITILNISTKIKSPIANRTYSIIFYRIYIFIIKFATSVHFIIFLTNIFILLPFMETFEYFIISAMSFYLLYNNLRKFILFNCFTYIKHLFPKIYIKYYRNPIFFYQAFSVFVNCIGNIVGYPRFVLVIITSNR